MVHVVFMSQSNKFHLSVESLFQRLRQHRHTVLASLPSPNHDLPPVKVEINDSNRAAFRDPHPGAVQQFHHKSVRSVHG